MTKNNSNGITVTPDRQEQERKLREARKLATRAQQMLVEYENYKITTSEGYVKSAEDFKKVQAREKELIAARKNMTDPGDEQRRRIVEFFNPPLVVLKQIRYKIDGAMRSYRQVVEQKRQEQERKLQEQARREEERKRKALEEQARKQEEKAAELRRKMAEVDKKERQVLKEKAMLAEEKAEEKREMQEEVYVPAPIVPTQTPKIKGIAIRKNWKYRIVNIKLLPREFMIENDKMLGQYARSTKGKIPVAGVEFYCEEKTGGVRM